MSRSRSTYHRDYPVSHSYDGVQRALADEYEQHVRTPLVLYNYHPVSSTLYRLDFPPGTLEGLERPISEGWTVDRGLPGERPRVVSVDEDLDQLYVRFSAPRNGHVFQQQVTLLEPDFLLRFREWLDNNQGRALPALWSELAKRKDELLSESSVGLGPSQLEELRAAQRQALYNSSPGVSYLWGPPGTGKTFTVARLVQSLRERGFKVLILAPTNVAVDVALLAAYRAMESAGGEPEGGYFVRPGYPMLPALDNYPVLLAWQEVLKNQERVLIRIERERKSLERQMTSSRGVEREELAEKLALLKAEDVDARRDRNQQLWSLAENAKVLATTVHSALHANEVLAFMSTSKLAVIVDEAGMVPRFNLLPLLEILSGAEGIQDRALTRLPEQLLLTFAGDPLQLAPIFRENNTKDVNRRYWLGQSLMEVLLEEKRSGGRRTFLDEQSRMDATICRRISETYYKGDLRTVADSHRPAPPLVTTWPEDGLVLLEPIQYPVPHEAPPATWLDSGAKFDDRSGWVGVALIREALKQESTRSVLWVTPFRDQADTLRKFASSYFSDADVRVGTIHTSQGSEADLVVFDLVNPSHQWLKGQMGQELDIERLLNVGVSRGRGQVIVLGSPGKVKTNPILWRLLHDAYLWTPSGAVRDTVKARPRVRVRRVGGT